MPKETTGDQKEVEIHSVDHALDAFGRGGKEDIARVARYLASASEEECVEFFDESYRESRDMEMDGEQPKVAYPMRLAELFKSRR